MSRRRQPITSFCDGCGIINGACICRQQSGVWPDSDGPLDFDFIAGGRGISSCPSTGSISVENPSGRRKWTRNAPTKAVRAFRSRRIWPSMYAPTVWATPNLSHIVHIVENDPGVRVRAYLGNGQDLWTFNVPLPRPIFRPDKTPRRRNKRVETEVLQAFFLARTDLLVFAVQRASPRRGIRKAASSRLELRALDHTNGSIRWTSGIDDVEIFDCATPRPDGLFWSRTLGFGDIDMSSGAIRHFLDAQGLPAWPVAIGPRVACAWHSKGRLHTAWVDRASSKVIASHSTSCTLAPKNLEVLALDKTAIVHVGSQRFILLDEGARPLWCVRLPHWFRSVHEISPSCLRIGLSSHVAEVHPATGRLLRVSPRPPEPEDFSL